MAVLSDAQKAQIRLALGYPDLWRYRNTRLESVMDSVSPEAVDQLDALLTSLTTVETQILSSITVGADGVKRVDDIQFFDPINGISTGYLSAQKAAKYLSGKISILLGVPFYGDAYGTSGYPGDSFFGSNGGSTSGNWGFG